MKCRSLKKDETGYRIAQISQGGTASDAAVNQQAPSCAADDNRYFEAIAGDNDLLF